jgi:lipopolysaccharide biosynthesis glycosyltransferase
MSKISVAFAINDAYTEYLNTAIYSLLKNNPDNQFCIYVLCKSLTKRNKQSIKKILNYYDNAEIEIVELNNHAERFNSLTLTIQYISIETYYRYILAELFPTLNRIIYLDADILVIGDLSKLYDETIDDFYAAGVNDGYISGLTELDGSEKSLGYKELIGFKQDELYINAGVMLLNLKKIRDDNITTLLFENTIHLINTIKFQDQDVINITMQGKVKAISNTFNYTDQDKKDDNKKTTELAVIHYTGSTKPWKNAVFASFQIPFVELYRKYVNEYNELLYGSVDKFALYTFFTENIGDDIQSVAARRFLPRIDHHINRDLAGEWQNVNQEERVKLITNGWYMHAPYSWPIQDRTIDPLYISMYVEQSSPAVIEKLLSKESRKNFEKSDKIGARDKSTYEFLKKNNLSTYLSGCLTLTLQKDKSIKKEDFILLTDVSEEVYESIRKSTKRRVIYLTNAINSFLQQPQQREDLAEIYLYLYQSAHCVITERLHSALPSLALETPVVLIKKDAPVGGNKNRLAGLDDLVNCYTEDEFLSEKVYDLENLPSNPSNYLKYRKDLIKKSAEFTGFDNTESFAWSDIGEKTLDEVLAQLELIKNINLKDATTELMQATHQISNLSLALEQKNAEIDRQNIEIARLMGVKAATRRLAGNVRRRVSGKTK